MRTIQLLLCVMAVTACASLRRPAPPREYQTPAAALDCAETVLESSGFQVQGDDVGARSYERMVPGRRENYLRARQNSGVTGEVGYVSAGTTPRESGAYILWVSGVTTRTDGTQVTSLLHEQGVNAVITKCGATRAIG